MHGDALATRDVADNLLAADRAATSRTEHHDVVEASDLDLLFTRAEHAPDDGRDGPFRRFLVQLVGRNELDEHLLGLDLTVSDGRKQIVHFLHREVRQRLCELLAVDDGLRVDVVAARLLLEQLASELDRARLLFRVNQVLDLVARARRRGEVEPVTARPVPGLRDDFDDVAVLEARAERHDLAVHPRADALMADIGVNRVGKIDGRRAAWQRLHQTFWREGVDLLGIQLDLEVLDELLRIADFLLVFEKLAHPLEVPIVAVVADPPFLVLPVRRNPLLRPPVHFNRPYLHFEGHPVLADHRGVQRLVAVGAWHRDEILDAPRHR